MDPLTKYLILLGIGCVLIVLICLVVVWACCKVSGRISRLEEERWLNERINNDRS
jgi:Na+-transporting methylmalonyl-CoA/oxaloacetate decarboxylase gamma subunit